MKILLFRVVQCTWGILQTIGGVLIFLIHAGCKHEIYRGCVNTHWKSHAGLSLGLFIFTPAEDDRMYSEIRTHEYGHTFQSLILGPLYLLVVGVISIIWADLPHYRRLRAEKHLPYTACFVEKNASWFGEKVTGEKAVQ